MDQHTLSVKRIFGLALLTAGALLIHGYHPYAEDSEIYLPGVLKILNPSLFPANAEFFSDHAGHTLYPNLIAFSVRATHLPLPWAAFLWHLISIFLLLAASWRLASAIFENEKARWGAVALMSAMLTLPIAGTALYIFDQYLNPRNLAAFAALFAAAEVLHQKHGRALLWLAFAALLHPLMASFAIAFCAWLIVLDRYRPRLLGFAAALPFGLTLDPPPPAYHQVALRQPYFYIQRWQWYEWLGLIGPVILFWTLAGFARRRKMNNLELVSRAVVPFVLVATAAAIVLSIPPRFEALARLEPLRCLALAYMLLIVIGGGLLGQYILHARIWRWLVVFVPLSLGMYFAQRQSFPASTHIEWPSTPPHNQWAQAFEWIRGNTPMDALFALDPRHMELPGEDENGFRARAERSMLADLVKDKGACSMFPPLSVQWLEQVEDQKNWKHFHQEDFERLRRKYGVSWVVLEQPGLEEHGSAAAAMECPYENSTVRVCRLD
ncbi:MAG TPA: hypothetical protein VKD23_09380 [Terriglobales bacterium]|nr:hypothetical protein [Terriglobales bacterium]